MKSAILLCKWADCGIRLAYAGDGPLPSVCPTCKRTGKWSLAPRVVTEPAAFKFSESDRQFLRTIRVAVTDD